MHHYVCIPSMRGRVWVTTRDRQLMGRQLGLASSWVGRLGLPANGSATRARQLMGRQLEFAGSWVGNSSFPAHGSAA